MPKDKVAAQHNLMTITLTDEELYLLEAFATEQEIDDLEQAIPAMIHELVKLHDQLWDAQFAESTAPLDKKAFEAHEADKAGLTEDFDT